MEISKLKRKLIRSHLLKEKGMSFGAELGLIIAYIALVYYLSCILLPSLL